MLNNSLKKYILHKYFPLFLIHPGCFYGRIFLLDFLRLSSFLFETDSVGI